MQGMLPFLGRLLSCDCRPAGFTDCCTVIDHRTAAWEPALTILLPTMLNAQLPAPQRFHPTRPSTTVMSPALLQAHVSPPHSSRFPIAVRFVETYHRWAKPSVTNPIDVLESDDSMALQHRAGQRPGGEPISGRGAGQRPPWL